MRPPWLVAQAAASLTLLGSTLVVGPVSAQEAASAGGRVLHGYRWRPPRSEAPSHTR